MLNTKTKRRQAEKTKQIIGGICGLILIMVVVMQFTQSSQEISYYEAEQKAFSFSETLPEYTSINGDQIIRVTKDGINAYNVEGEEIWTDTLTLDNIVVREREPYFAIANMNDRTIHLFSEKGREGEIIVEHPIVYFSLNHKGDVAVIQELEEGHNISAYTLNGHPISGSRTTFIKNAGFPISAEVSNDSQMLIASYIDIYSPRITSVIVGMPIGITEPQAVDNITYGIEIKDNIIYDIEFITDDLWVAVGEEGISYHNVSDGKRTIELPETYLMQPPYIRNDNDKGYIAIVGKYVEQGSNTFGEQILWIYDKKGELVLEQVFEQPIEFYKASEKGVVIGQGNNYEGYTPSGVHNFSFHSTYQLEDIGYVSHELIAVTKNEVFNLKRVQKGTTE